MEKNLCEKLFGKVAKSGAKKLCSIGECIAEYDCGHSNRKSGPFKHAPLKTGTDVCPLAKYGMKPEENPKPWWERRSSEIYLSTGEFFALCACCENAEVEEEDDEYVAHRKDLHACFGCPVKMAEDAMQEAEAEARLS